MIVNFSFINPREPKHKVRFNSFCYCVNRILFRNKKQKFTVTETSTTDGQKEVSGFLEQPKLSFLYPEAIGDQQTFSENIKFIAPS